MHLSSHGNHKSAGLPSQTGKHSARQANEDTKPVPHVAGVPETISEDVEGKACPSFHAGRRNQKSWGGASLSGVAFDVAIIPSSH